MLHVVEPATFVAALMIVSTILLAVKGAYFIGFFASERATEISMSTRKRMIWLIGISVLAGYFSILLSIFWFTLRSGSSLSDAYLITIWTVFLVQLTMFVPVLFTLLSRWYPKK
jgi:hypothetical protein